MTKICGNCDQEIREDEDGDWTTVMSWGEGGTGTLCGRMLGDHQPYGIPAFADVYPQHALNAWSAAMEHIWTIDALMDGPDVWHYYVPRELTTGTPKCSCRGRYRQTFFGGPWGLVGGHRSSSVWIIDRYCPHHGDTALQEV